jgi:hypothetical protein
MSPIVASILHQLIVTVAVWIGLRLYKQGHIYGAALALGLALCLAGRA